MIGRGWRLMGTGLSFVLFGVGGLLLTMLVLPVISVFSHDQNTRTFRSRSAVSCSFQLFLWVMHGLGVVDFQVDPRCKGRLHEAGGLIVVANHPTLIDVVRLLAEVKHGNCIVKRAVWRNPFMAGVVRAASYISNEDAESLLSRCAEVLKQGETLVIFPEATRTVPGQPMCLRRGAARIALYARVPVQLVYLSSDPPTLSKGERWYRIPPRRPCMGMTVGDRLDAGAFTEVGEEPSIASRRLTQLMYEKLMGHVDGNGRDRTSN